MVPNEVKIILEDLYMKKTDNCHSFYTMVLPTYNEESRVERVLDYYSFFGDVVVIDNFSSDKTGEICKRKKVGFFQIANSGTIQTKEWMEIICSIVKSDYVVLLSCSEFHPRKLMELYGDVARDCSYDLVSVVRDSYTSGKLIQLWGGRFSFSEARIERFFNIRNLDFDKIRIHGHFMAINKLSELHLDREDGYVVSHLRDVDVIELIKKSNEYASVEAAHRIERGKAITFSRLIALVFKECLRFIHLPLNQWSMMAFREVWVRIVMHSIIALRCWELRTGNEIASSRAENDKLWNDFVKTCNASGDN